MTSISASSKEEIYPVYCHILSPTIGRWCPLWAKDVNVLQDVGIFFDGRKLLHYGNHPVKWVRLTGVIVAIDYWGNAPNFKRVYTLDDSSGSCIECSAPAPAPTFFEDRNKSFIAQSQCEKSTNKVAKEANRNPEQIVQQRQYEGAKKSNHQSEQSSVAPSVLNPSIPWERIHIGSVVKIKGKVDLWWDQKRIEIVKLELLQCTDMEVRCWNEVVRFRQDILDKPWTLTQKQELRCKKHFRKQLKKKSLHRMSTKRKSHDK